METGGVAGERPTGDPPAFTFSVVDSQRDTPVIHQVTDLSPERRSRKKVRNPQNRPGPLATPHTVRVPPSPCFQDGGWECTHLPKGPSGVCQEPNLRRKQKSQKNLHLGPRSPAGSIAHLALCVVDACPLLSHKDIINCQTCHHLDPLGLQSASLLHEPWQVGLGRRTRELAGG